jgi:hypothetical protein
MTFNILVCKPGHDGSGVRESDGERAEQREREQRRRGGEKSVENVTPSREQGSQEFF